MQEIFGTWGPELMAYSHQNPLRVVAAALGAISLVLTLVSGKLSWSGDGGDSGGFYFGDGDGGSGD
jgi:hypothetical protein